MKYIGPTDRNESVEIEEMDRITLCLLGRAFSLTREEAVRIADALANLATVRIRKALTK